jgi:hypothetical protein
MIVSNDQRLLEEAYISAVKRAVETPNDDVEVVKVGPEKIEMGSEHEEHGFGDEMEGEEEESCGCEDESEEIAMAKTNLFSIFKSAKELHDCIASGYHLEPWMLQKIAVCADNICSVHRTAEYKAAEREQM